MCVCVCGEASCVWLPRDRWRGVPQFAAQSGSGEYTSSFLAACLSEASLGGVVQHRELQQEAKGHHGDAM